jgi:hypothetical protein
MGTLFYGAGRLAINFDDRVLAHLQIVISTKLRRQEYFMLNWRDDESVGDGRSSIWISPHTDLHFKYAGGRFPEIDRAWIEALSVSAASPLGLQLRDEGTLNEPARSESESHRPIF